MLSLLWFALAAVSSSSSSADAFMLADVRPLASLSIRRLPHTSPTELFLEDWVADMIDRELHRQSHKKEFENEWMEKNRAAVFAKFETDFTMMEVPDKTEFVMHRKDEKMAKEDPQRYCADRCVATGNCDIFEDFFDMSPQDVIAFCTECVLSEDEEECAIPDGFYDKLMP